MRRPLACVRALRLAYLTFTLVWGLASQSGEPAPGDSRTFLGVLRELGEDRLVLEDAKAGTVTLVVRDDSVFLQEDREIARQNLHPGDELEVRAQPDAEGRLVAERVTVLAIRAGAGEISSASHTTIDDPGPPVLRHRRPGEKPAHRRTPETSDEESRDLPGRLPSPAAASGNANAAKPAASNGEGAALARARQEALAFSDRLPNFICRQVTTRYMSEKQPPNWHAVDVLEANLIYEDSAERYENIRLNGKPASAEKAQESGSWSTGEYGTTLRMVLEPASRAVFRFRGNDRVGGRSAKVYSYRIDQPWARWEISIEDKSAFPAFEGAIWVDRDTFRVLRIEMETIDLERELPMRVVQTTLDYGLVRIGTAEYVLPVVAENLGCWAGTSRCSKNRIEFLNYRKFGAESTLIETKTPP